jgi:DNA-binding NtrC family response regulator
VRAIDDQPEDIMRSVLIVDDEAPIREFLTRWLRKSNYDTTEAADAEAALALVSERQPDVVLCDVHMPGRDGLWLMEQLRVRFPGVAIVLATANEDVPPVVSMQRGVVEYLVKPFERDSVLEAVSRAMKWRETHGTAAATSPAADTLSEWLNGGRK